VLCSPQSAQRSPHRLYDDQHRGDRWTRAAEGQPGGQRSKAVVRRFDLPATCPTLAVQPTFETAVSIDLQPMRRPQAHAGG